MCGSFHMVPHDRGVTVSALTSTPPNPPWLSQATAGGAVTTVSPPVNLAKERATTSVATFNGGGFVIQTVLTAALEAHPDAPSLRACAQHLSEAIQAMHYAR